MRELEGGIVINDGARCAALAEKSDSRQFVYKVVQRLPYRTPRRHLC